MEAIAGRCFVVEQTSLNALMTVLFCLPFPLCLNQQGHVNLSDILLSCTENRVFFTLPPSSYLAQLLFSRCNPSIDVLVMYSSTEHRHIVPIPVWRAYGVLGLYNPMTTSSDLELCHLVVNSVSFEPLQCDSVPAMPFRASHSSSSYSTVNYLPSLCTPVCQRHIVKCVIARREDLRWNLGMAISELG